MQRDPGERSPSTKKRKNPSKQVAADPGLGRRLRRARERAQLTQREVERALHLPATAVARYESRQGPVPRLARLQRLAMLYGSMVEALVSKR